MKIAILGGSFDPPHIGHMQVAKQVKEILNMDQVWLMPCFLHPFNKNLSAPQHRLKMTKYLEDDDIKVSDFEIKQKKVSYTIDTLDVLSKKYPQHKFSWTISSSELENFHKWKNWEEIIKKYNLIIFPRNIEKKDFENLVKKNLKLKQNSKNIIILSTQNLSSTNISSTEIRQKVKEGLLITNLVNNHVEKFIINTKLYK